jgi:xylulokinase
MNDRGYALGIDSSTQGTTAVLVDRESFALVAEAKVRYRDDPRLQGFGLIEGSPLLPPREEGEADQPALLFLAALDAVLSDLPASLLCRVDAIAVSAQQHGQVWLGQGAKAACSGLRLEGAGRPGRPGLAERFAPALASGRSPIWMSANTSNEAEELREAAGGADAMTALSGSDSPLRFSGAVLRHRALQEPEAYAACARIHLISSFLASVLSGREDAPIDWGNGAGMSLMDWGRRCWSELLVKAASDGLPGGAPGLCAKLPALAHPLAPVGSMARYFTERYGIPATAIVVAGSGDNPQTKVLASGSLLSLGTSFVLMAEGARPHRDANAMYDGLGRPFLFGCRTNGSLAWEAVRLSHGLDADDFAAAESALAATAPGSVLRILQRERESFPPSPPVDFGRREDFAEDYAGAVDSSLGLLWLGSRDFAEGPATGHGEISVTGGAAASDGTLRRIAAIWGRPVARIGEAGAAAGAAVAAAAALAPEAGRVDYAARAAALVSGRGARIEPDPRDLAAYHGEGGYLHRLARLFEAGFSKE